MPPITAPPTLLRSSLTSVCSTQHFCVGVPNTACEAITCAWNNCSCGRGRASYAGCGIGAQLLSDTGMPGGTMRTDEMLSFMPIAPRLG